MDSVDKKSKVSIALEKIGRIIDARYVSIAALFYLVCICWILAFPLVSVSTGELKPRGLFVDENSLLVNNVLPGHFKSNVSLVDIPIGVTTFLPQANKSLVHYLVESRFTSRSLESIMLVLPYNVELQDSMNVLIYNLFSNLESSKWLAKRVIILPIALDSAAPSMSSSSLLKPWLSTYHRHLASNSNMLLGVGLIREAYVVDLSSLNSSSVRNSIPQFSSLQLLYSGVNGQLPNMDMVSFPLTSFRQFSKSWTMTTESDTLFLQRLYQSLHTCRTSGNVYFSTFSHLLVSLADTLYPITTSLLPDGYYSLLSGVLSSLSNLALGPTGLHHLFLDMNIDAITVKVLPVSSSGSSSSSNSNYGRGGVTGRSGSDDSLLSAIMRLVYISSSLHEELHHSFTYYLIMGTGHFVGLTEYGLVAGMMMLSLLTLYLHYAYQCSASLLLPALSAVLWDVWPPLALLCVVWFRLPVNESGNSSVILSHSSAVSVMAVVYCVHMLPTGGLSRKTTNKGDRSWIAEYVTLVVTVLLCLFAWLAAQHFSLAISVYLIVMPSLLVMCHLCPSSQQSINSNSFSSGAGNRLLEFLSVVWSPCGVYLTLYCIDSALVQRLLNEWLEFGSFSFPFTLVITSLISHLSNRVQLLRHSHP